MHAQRHVKLELNKLVHHTLRAGGARRQRDGHEMRMRWRVDVPARLYGDAGEAFGRVQLEARLVRRHPQLHVACDHRDHGAQRRGVVLAADEVVVVCVGQRSGAAQVERGAVDAAQFTGGKAVFVKLENGVA